MPRFRQTERLACWVTWIKEVEAADAEEAWDKFSNGEGELISEEIGDSLDGHDQCTIEEIGDACSG